jgi:hypothetical protein
MDTQLNIEILVIEDFNCRLRRGPPDYKKNYYFLDGLITVFEYFGAKFLFFPDFRDFPIQPNPQTAQILLLSPPTIPFSAECQEKIIQWVTNGGALLITAKDRMENKILASYNAILAHWGVSYNRDTIETPNRDLAYLTNITGDIEKVFSHLLYDTGCSINVSDIIPSSPNSENKGRGYQKIGFTIRQNEQYGVIGLEKPSEGRVVICGTYWPWTFHGSSGFTPDFNSIFVYLMFLWLGRKLLAVPSYYSGIIQQIRNTRTIKPEFFPPRK